MPFANMICEEKSHCQTGEPTAPEWSCKKQLAAADRVIEAGYTKNNLQATIDGIPAGEFYAKQVQKAVEAERKEIANSIENYLNISPKELPRLVKELRGE